MLVINQREPLEHLDILSKPPTYQVVCKNEQGAFFDGYVFYNNVMLHLDLAIYKDNIVFGGPTFIKLEDTLNNTGCDIKIITYNGQQYVALKWREGNVLVTNDYFLQRVLCSDVNDVIEIANTEGVTENADVSFKLETDASQA